MARNVFDILTTDELAMEDLGLPPKQHLLIDFQFAMEKILYKFITVEENVEEIPRSITHPVLSFGSCSATVRIFFKLSELQIEDKVVCARFIHETTHAMRFHLVKYAVHPEKIPSERKEHVTPQKDPKLFLHKELATGDLYMLKNKAFHSGYYIEHMLQGGIGLLCMVCCSTK